MAGALCRRGRAVPRPVHTDRYAGVQAPPRRAHGAMERGAYYSAIQPGWREEIRVSAASGNGAGGRADARRTGVVPNRILRHTRADRSLVYLVGPLIEECYICNTRSHSLAAVEKGHRPASVSSANVLRI